MTTRIADPGPRLAAAPPRHLLGAEDLGGLGLTRLLDRAELLRSRRHSIDRARPLDGKQVALLFEKPSLRTRVSFEVAVTGLGGHAIALGPDEVGLGRRESAADVARNLSRLVDAIVLRTFAHETLTEMAAAASVPVVNALTDAEHPCQALADLLTLRRRFGRLAGLRLAYVGDGNNVANSLMLAGALAGLDVRIATPAGYAPDATFIERARELAAQHRTRFSMGKDPLEAVTGADAVYTDVWASMGREDEVDERRLRFAGFEVTERLLAHAAPHVVALHCMPAHRGEEISAAVLDGPRSLALEQAQNRRHVQEALLIALLGPR
ncbi:MAG: ornithine carbamoyltransferase [Chloroflexi bacterium]|nr:ornithine carbamoyltransferase [Chloroflexota bacterium]